MDTAPTPNGHRAGKVRCNLWLTREARRMADDLARRRGISATAVIEQAIRVYCAEGAASLK